jgi:dolichyl-phosphate beta-glucosyltransferase
MSFQPRIDPITSTLLEIDATTPYRLDLRTFSDAGVTVVVPCYNEAKRLNVAAFFDFMRKQPEMSLLFVNDGSKDETLSVLAEIQAAMPGRVDIIDLLQNSGKAEAVRRGIQHAAARGDALIAYWDADLATPLTALPDFTRIADLYDDVEVIFGSRRMMLGHRIERTFKRRMISRVCSQLARLALRLPIGDTQCGAKLLRNTEALRAAVSTPFTAGWVFDVELFSRIASGVKDRKLAFYEMPLSAWSEIPGSKVSTDAIIKSGFQMLRLIAENRLGIRLPMAKVAPTGARMVSAPNSAYKMATQ